MSRSKKSRKNEDSNSSSTSATSDSDSSSTSSSSSSSTSESASSTEQKKRKAKQSITTKCEKSKDGKAITKNEQQHHSKWDSPVDGKKTIYTVKREEKKTHSRSRSLKREQRSRSRSIERDLHREKSRSPERERRNQRNVATRSRSADQPRRLERNNASRSRSPEQNRRYQRNNDKRSRSPDRNRRYQRENDRRFEWHRDESIRHEQRRFNRDRSRSRDRLRNERPDNRYRNRRSRSRGFRNEQDNERKKFGRHSPRREAPRRRGRSCDKDDNREHKWGKKDEEKAQNKSANYEPAEKEKPSFALSGALTEDTNKVNGVVVKYSEPPEARKPKRRWRLYPFKGETALPTLHIHRQSCFLVGRDRKVVDLAVDHPSCSKQHAALQYRLVPFEREDGTQGKRVRLYLIDLDSANGTFLNNKKIDPRKYYELFEKDVIKFGFSTREYVLLHENSKEDKEDDDVTVKDEPEDIPEGHNT